MTAGRACACPELKVEGQERSWRAVLGMECTEIPAYGQHEQSAYKGHYESTCYHPLLLFICIAMTPYLCQRKTISDVSPSLNRVRQVIVLPSLLMMKIASV